MSSGWWNVWIGKDSGRRFIMCSKIRLRWGLLCLFRQGCMRWKIKVGKKIIKTKNNNNKMTNKYKHLNHSRQILFHHQPTKSQNNHNHSHKQRNPQPNQFHLISHNLIHQHQNFHNNNIIHGIVNLKLNLYQKHYISHN